MWESLQGLHVELELLPRMAGTFYTIIFFGGGVSECVCAQVRVGGQGQRKRQNPKQAPRSVQSPMLGLIP